jgi:hypothetical protein
MLPAESKRTPSKRDQFSYVVSLPQSPTPTVIVQSFTRRESVRMEESATAKVVPEAEDSEGDMQREELPAESKRTPAKWDQVTHEIVMDMNGMNGTWTVEAVQPVSSCSDAAAGHRESQMGAGGSAGRPSSAEGWEDALLLLSFVAAALVAGTPRALALLGISYGVPRAPLPQALDSFKSMWASCKDPNNLFPAYSPDGQLYRWLITIDDAFICVGGTFAAISVASILYINGNWANGTRQKRVLRYLFYLYCALALGNLIYTMASYSEMSSSITRDSLAGMYNENDDIHNGYESVGVTDFSVSQLTLFLLNMALLSVGAYGGYSLLRVSVHSDCRHASCCSSPQALGCSGLRCSAVVLVTLSSAFLYGLWWELLPVLWRFVLAKMLTMMIRAILIQNLSRIDSGDIDLANMMLISIESVVSIAVRGKSGWILTSASTGSELMNTAMVSVGICLLEAVVYSWSCFVNITRSHGQIFKGLNAKTLDGVLEAYHLYQRQMQVFYGHLLASELTETTVCVLMSLYDAAMPEWNQETTWHALTDFHGSRRVNEAAKLAVRLGIQVSGGVIAFDELNF